MWQYERTQRDGLVIEHSSETSKFGKVIGFCWMQLNTSGNEWTLLSAHVDGTIVCWKIMPAKAVQDKMFQPLTV